MFMRFIYLEFQKLNYTNTNNLDFQRFGNINVCFCNIDICFETHWNIISLSIKLIQTGEQLFYECYIFNAYTV